MRNYIILLSIIVISVIVIWFIYKNIRDNKINKKYGISRSGGRVGYLLYESNGKKAKIAWEILVGDIKYVLYDKVIEWVEPNKEIFTPQEKDIFYNKLNAWAKEQKIKYDSEV